MALGETEGETELEMVERHIRQGERHVLRQREIIAEMDCRGQWTGVAEDLLLNFEFCLRGHKAHLEQII